MNYQIEAVALSPIQKQDVELPVASRFIKSEMVGNDLTLYYEITQGSSEIMMVRYTMLASGALYDLAEVGEYITTFQTLDVGHGDGGSKTPYALHTFAKTLSIRPAS